MGARQLANSNCHLRDLISGGDTTPHLELLVCIGHEELLAATDSRSFTPPEPTLEGHETPASSMHEALLAWLS
jgi:hypothetical protein